MTQCDLILQHLLGGGSLTALDSLNLFGCLSLSQRIGDLKRSGHPILSELIETPSHKHISRYSYDFGTEKVAY